MVVKDHNHHSLKSEQDVSLCLLLGQKYWLYLHFLPKLTQRILLNRLSSYPISNSLILASLNIAHQKLCMPLSATIWSLSSASVIVIKYNAPLTNSEVLPT